MTDDLPYVPVMGLNVHGDAIGEERGQCGVFYHGIYERCSKDAEYRTNVQQGRRGCYEPVPLCEDHAAEFADCACDGEHLDRRFHREDQCVDDVDELDDRRDDGRDRPDREDRDFEDYFAPS